MATTTEGARMMSSVSATLTLTVGHPTSLSPDGSKIIGQPNGGGNGTLTTPYGTITFGDKKAPPDSTHAGTFCVPLLNGVEMNPGGPNIGAFGFPAMMQLWVANGGNLYGVGNDQLWSGWDRYTWVGNAGDGFAGGPSPIPTPGPLPVYNPPYTPSLDNSTILGGTGSLTTADGIWTFGVAVSGGWHLQLNGIEVWEYLGGPGPIVVDQMTVNSHSRMFFRRTEGTKAGWRLWAMHQQNISTGPTASPVPINLSILPSRPGIPSGSPSDTFIADIVVVMSDGSPFIGTLGLLTNADNSNYFKIVGSKVFVNTTPPNNFYINILSAQQNGTTLQTICAFGVPN